MKSGGVEGLGIDLHIREFITVATLLKDKLWTVSEMRLREKLEMQASGKSLTARVARDSDSHT